MKLRNSLRSLAAAGLILGAIGVSAGSASAAAKDGWLTSGELGLFCYSNQGNSVFDLYTSEGDFQDDYFKGSQSCANHTTNDYTESFSSKDSYTWDVYTDAWGGGSGGYISPNTKGNFGSTFFNSVSSAYVR
ncbi:MULTISPECIES: hypothetical protein [unclassified Streptomyces]|uniref:hypothetical protein n=1 Tax=unclassified Streptomyces TaxID=2593676 RepID=UPI00224F6B97|nr:MULTISPECIES: hypothetical protein [unclassified Streptomyces]MCX5146205.1 hypothetical protein [Streptomyces sp. NBC_00320]WSN49428.1 hypothetical protein OG299_17855 [Streptomyces sp. NBC_01296]WSW61171.1 hypothetical protein OG513_22795 [Streptomyces sp. NBC_00998]